MPDAVKRTHSYHAEAEVLKGNLRLPLVQEIKSQSNAKLAEAGGYLAQHETDYRLESVMSFNAAHTHVAGNPGLKPGHGWTTLASSAVEGLNVLNVVTADRVVGQVSLDYPAEGYVPAITFLGTQFVNLRIAGHPVKVEIDLDLFGSKPDEDGPYTKTPGLLAKVAGQHAKVREHPNLLQDLLKRYTGVSTEATEQQAIECSIVKKLDCGDGGAFPGTCHGHVIYVPGFGTIILGAVRLEHSKFEDGVFKKTLVQLTMIELKMGCIAEGETRVSSLVTNGMTKP
jgi:hypothetical protein